MRRTAASAQVAMAIVMSMACSLCTQATSRRAIAAQSGTQRRPNIVFIMTDQQHAGMMSCTGNPDLKTPALDRLAASGIRFERAYATNPVCMPSRFSLQTGHMPSEVGMRQNQNDITVPEAMVTASLGPLFRNAGYDCAYGGKVHLSKNLTKYIFQHGYEQLTSDARDDLADTCVTFLKQPHEKPFFLFASFINPHDICYMAINDFARSQGKPIRKNRDSKICEQTLDTARQNANLEAFIRAQCPPLPGNVAPPQNEPECITTHYVRARTFRQYAREQWSDGMWRLHRWLYARLTESADAQIGRVLQAVADAGLQNETLIVFTSDHGDMDSAHRLEHKSVLYEESVRIPFLMSCKARIPAGQVDRTHLVSNGLDLLPTLCDYAGIKAPEGLSGRSLRPLAEQKELAGWRDHLVTESQNGRMVCTERFKYCVYDCGEHREVLTDLQKDPGEMTNLADATEHRETLNRHRRFLYDWVSQQNDTVAKPYVVMPNNSSSK